MPDRLLDNPNPARLREDSDAAPIVTSAPVPQASKSRSAAEEMDRRRLLRLQVTALLILAAAAVLTMMYTAKLILVVVLVSILTSFVLAPLVDLFMRLRIPRGLGALIAVVTLVALLIGASLLQPRHRFLVRTAQVQGEDPADDGARSRRG
jgi:hypothetical protein